MKDSVTLGYFLLFAVGICWTLTGITVSEAKSKNCNILAFYCVGSFLAMLLLTVSGGLPLLRELCLPEKRFAIGCFAVCSFLNGTGQGITMWNLKKGGRALAFAIPQMSFLLPFLWSIFFWSQRLTWFSGSGISLIVVSTLYLSMGKHQGSNSELELKRIFISIAAMLICGISQILLIIPTQFPAERTLSPLTSSWVILAANAFFFLILLLGSGSGKSLDLKLALKCGSFWGLFAALSYCALLPTIRIFGKVGKSGIVYAAGCGMAITLFTLFTVIRYHEKQSFARWLAFFGIIIGIILVRI